MIEPAHRGAAQAPSSSDLPFAPSFGVMETVECAESRRKLRNSRMQKTFQLEIPGGVYPTICERTVYRSAP